MSGTGVGPRRGRRLVVLVAFQDPRAVPAGRDMFPGPAVLAGQDGRHLHVGQPGLLAQLRRPVLVRILLEEVAIVRSDRRLRVTACRQSPF
jgi:hypothetical protein